MLKISASNASAAANANVDFPTPVGPQTTSTDVVFASFIGAGHYTQPAGIATTVDAQASCLGRVYSSSRSAIRSNSTDAGPLSVFEISLPASTRYSTFL